MVVYAKTAPELGARGVTAFIVEKGIKGFSTAQKLDKLGMRGSHTGEMVFQDVEVPAENILSGLNGGARVLLSGLDYERAVLAAGPIGIMQAVIDYVVPYVHDRKQFGQSIGEFQLIQGKLADMYTVLQAGRAFCYTVGKNLALLGADHVRQVRKDCTSVILSCAEEPPGWPARASRSSAAAATSTTTRWAVCGATPSSARLAPARAKSAAC